MIETKLLRSALVLAEHGNFTRAAEALDISQPNLTRQIQALERTLGAQLFIRRNTGVVPSPAGREVLEQAVWIVAAVSDLEQRVQQTLNLESGLLRIGAGIYPANSIVGPAFSRFNRSHPGVKIHVEVHDFRDLPRKLEQGQFDLIVLELSGLEDQEHLEIQTLNRHPGFFFCRKGHPILDTPLTVANLISYPLVAPALVERVVSALREGFRDTDNGSAASLEMMTMLCTDWGLMTRTVASSDAIGLGTYGTLKEELRSERFVPLRWESKGLTTNYGIVTLRDYPLSPAARVFADLLVQTDNELLKEESEGIWEGIGVRIRRA